VNLSCLALEKPTAGEIALPRSREELPAPLFAPWASAMVAAAVDCAAYRPRRRNPERFKSDKILETASLWMTRRGLDRHFAEED